MTLKTRLDLWLDLWQRALPAHKRSKPKKADWAETIERFIAALRADIVAQPLSWLARVRLLHRLQKALAAQGVPAEALRPLVLAIVLRVYLA